MENSHLSNTRFTSLNIDESIIKGLKNLNFEFCTPIQSESLPIALDGNDVAGQAQTGTGKTAAFLIAAIERVLKSHKTNERKKQPIDYRRTGVITLFTGVGFFLFGIFFLGSILKGVGSLVALIGVGQIVAGYLYPNTSEEITSAVDEFEKLDS